MLGSSSMVSRDFQTQYAPGTTGPVATRHGQMHYQRALAGGTQSLLLSGQGGITPDGPMVNRSGQRLPGGYGTDLTDPSTWRRRYAFPGGNFPQITAKQHFA